MPTAKVNDITIYYERHGSGDPLLLIGGLSNDLTDYTDRTDIVSLLAKSHTVIVFDNRGSGRTDKPDIPYSIAMMADDARGLLLVLGIEQAHILGVSMGGRIALDLALRYPEAVKKMILVSTSARVPKTWRRSFLLFLHRLPLPKGKYPQPHYAFRRQADASFSYDRTPALHQIQAPTLILHGKKDGIARFALAEEIYERIPQSKLLAFDGGHMFLFFQSRQFVEAVTRFLSEPA